MERIAFNFMTVWILNFFPIKGCEVIVITATPWHLTTKKSFYKFGDAREDFFILLLNSAGISIFFCNIVALPLYGREHGFCFLLTIYALFCV